MFLLPIAQLPRLFDAVGAGRTVIGPRVKDGAIVYGELLRADELPVGYGDEQSPGRYRLVQRDDNLLFAYAAPAGPLKRHFLPSREKLVTIRRSQGGLSIEAAKAPEQRFALFGVKPCDIAALGRLDTVLRHGAHPDTAYAARREDVLVIAAHCQHPAATCFCTSMGTGPSAHAFDLALREDTRPDRTHLYVTVGSAAGQQLLDSLSLDVASQSDQAWVAAAEQRASAQVVRNIDAEGVRRGLSQAPDHPAWEELQERCTSCGSCTSSCPTCFCSSVEDTTNLEGDTAERWRHEDSCFNTEFSYMHGGPVRASTKSRFRQWLTHKFSSWHEQFDESGCVGCGRCIAWCPVAIDMTAEATRISKPSPQGATA